SGGHLRDTPAHFVAEHTTVDHGAAGKAACLSAFANGVIETERFTWFQHSAINQFGCAALIHIAVFGVREVRAKFADLLLDPQFLRVFGGEVRLDDLRFYLDAAFFTFFGEDRHQFLGHFFWRKAHAGLSGHDDGFAAFDFE